LERATYPSNFANSLNPPSGFLTNIWQLDPAVIACVCSRQCHHRPLAPVLAGEMNVKEDDTAGYGMVEFGGEHWSGNLGVRIVNTEEKSIVNVPGGPNAITTSAFGPSLPLKLVTATWMCCPASI